jgi:hypothetical protein
VLSFAVINSESVDTFSGIMLGIAMYGIAILINGFVVLFTILGDIRIDNHYDSAKLNANKGKTILNG